MPQSARRRKAVINLKDEEARELEVVARLLLGRNAVVCGFQFEYVWRKHEHRRERLILWPRTGGHEAKALQDGRSAAWIGLILGRKCLLITERLLARHSGKGPRPDTTGCSEAGRLHRWLNGW